MCVKQSYNHSRTLSWQKINTTGLEIYNTKVRMIANCVSIMLKRAIYILQINNEHMQTVKLIHILLSRGRAWKFVFPLDFSFVKVQGTRRFSTVSVNNKSPKSNQYEIFHELTPVHKTFHELKIKSDDGCQPHNIPIINFGLGSIGWAAWSHWTAEAEEVKIIKILPEK